MRDFKKIIVLLIVVVLSIVFGVVYYNVNPANNTSELILPFCPLYKFIGIYCSGCGTQRAVHCLLHFEFYKAFRYNPLMVVFLPIILLLVIQKIAAFLEKPFEIHLFRKVWFLTFLSVVIVIYFIARNIPLGIFDALRPPLVGL